MGKPKGLAKAMSIKRQRTPSAGESNRTTPMDVNNPQSQNNSCSNGNPSSEIKSRRQTPQNLAPQSQWRPMNIALTQHRLNIYKKYRAKKEIIDSTYFTRPKIYPCMFCTKSFIVRKQYRSHVLRNHVDISKYCLRCYQKFPTGLLLRLHSRHCRKLSRMTVPSF